MKLPDVEAWALFVAVAERGGFSPAARALGLSVPTVSRAVARLEQRLGAVLFHRHSRRLALSALGREALPEAQALVAAAHRLEDEVGDAAAEPAGRIRLAAPMDFGRAHLAPLLPEFLAAHRAIAIDLDLDDARVDVVAGGHDLVLRIGTLADSTLLARRLCAVRLLPVAAPAYLAAAGRPAHPADLGRHRCLLYANLKPPGLWRFHRGAEHYTVTLRGVLSANSGGALMPALLQGAGVALQPDFLVRDALVAGTLERLLPDWQSDELALHLVTPPSPLRPHRVRLLMAYLAERLAIGPVLHD